MSFCCPIQKLASEHVVRHIYSKLIQFGNLKYYAIVMERCSSNLGQYVIECFEEEKRTPVSQNRSLLVSLVRQLLGAYTAIHKAGMCHRDVKPANILVIEKAGSFPVLKLCDFEHSKVFKPEGTTTMGTSVGTCDQHGCWWAPEVISPEAQGSHYRREDADVWPLGCIIHFIATDGQVKLFCAPKDALSYVEASKHLVLASAGQPEKLQAALTKSKLNETNYALFDLVEKLVRPASSRWKLASVLAHPVMWSSSTICKNITEFVNCFNDRSMSRQTRPMMDALNTGASEFANWPSSLNANPCLKRIIDENTLKHTPNLLTEAFHTSRMTSLMRVIRNVVQHCSKATTLGVPLLRTFVEQFVSVYPTLLPRLFDVSSRFGTWTIVNGETDFKWN